MRSLARSARPVEEVVERQTPALCEVDGAPGWERREKAASEHDVVPCATHVERVLATRAHRGEDRSARCGGILVDEEHMGLFRHHRGRTRDAGKPECLDQVVETASPIEALIAVVVVRRLTECRA